MKTAIRIILICIAVLIVATVGVTAFRALDSTNPISMTLHGQREIFLEYGQEYEEAGATAFILGKNVPVPVTCSGQVDTTRLGKQVIKYTAQANGHISTAYRYVHVMDLEAPIITLVNDPKAFTLVGDVYQEEGFTATDNRDGDLTHKVIRKERDGIITYTVADACGNTATVSRTINYIDPNSPILTLEGGLVSYIFAGENYVEPGCTATDFRDGDLSDNVIVYGDVDSSRPGIYTLKYSITNSIGKESVRERTVYVFQHLSKDDAEPETEPGTPPVEYPPTPGTIIEPNGKTIYLTFDDGPNIYTNRLLDVLKKYNVKVSFFVTGGGYPHILTRAAQEGHTIGIHTNTHKYSQIYSSDEAFMSDFEAIQKTIFEYTGQKCMLTRFPGGSSNTISSAYNKGIMTRLTKKLEALGYRYFDWNVDSDDAGRARTAEEVFKNVVTGIGNKQNSVVLQHDIRDYSVDAVEQIIAWGISNGYTFAPLTYDSPTCHHAVWN